MHLPFFDVVCTEVHCLPINYENNVTLSEYSMSLDSILVSSVVVVPTLSYMNMSPLFLFWYKNALFTNL